MKKFLQGFMLGGLVVLGTQLSADINSFARKWGGTVTHKLPAGLTVYSASWKKDDLWVLTRERLPTETKQNWVYKEFSNWGLVQGSVILEEQ